MTVTAPPVTSFRYRPVPVIVPPVPIPATKWGDAPLGIPARSRGRWSGSGSPGRSGFAYWFGM